MARHHSPRHPLVAGVELAQKIVKGQFDVPASFGTNPFSIWYNMLAA
jgi:hypothetical protein